MIDRLRSTGDHGRDRAVLVSGVDRGVGAPGRDGYEDVVVSVCHRGICNK